MFQKFYYMWHVRVFTKPVCWFYRIAHIIEHTVLNGSRDFPVKDPFRELAKGSLNTFLNAMTYPDKTVYPVASCNEKDFANLCHVYLDAVFHPNIYQEKRIFEQEGWHYEHDEQGRLTVNGVVFNEMKGAMSSPDDVLENAVYASLFPDTTYAMVSGGDPAVIPSLTYEAYLDFHRRYYHRHRWSGKRFPTHAVMLFHQFMEQKHLVCHDHRQ